ncbi:MAG: hypothetical protein JRM74_04975 [Nitrososphaerota archaeon]|nr:hypothetical protein [Nitrososphaerota archaeon]
MSPAKRDGPHPFSFAVGDWRGKGKQGPGEFPEYDSTFICLNAPGGKGVEIMQFDDDHEGGKVYYAEHLSVAPPVRGKMKVTRRGFAYADAGDTLFVTHEIAAKDGDGVRISPDPKKKNFLNNDLRLSKEGPDGLKVVGSASAGGGSWTFEFHFKRRNAKR